MRQRAPFRRFVDQVLAECAARNLDVPRTVVEDLVADRVTAMAAALQVREDTVVRSYLPTISPADLVAALEQAHVDAARELAETPPTVLDLASAGRLAASLGQAVRCVSLNHDRLRGPDRDKWPAISVLDDAGNGLTLLGAALQQPDVAAGQVALLLDDDTVLYTRRALTQTVQHLTVGDWSFGHGPDIDTGVAERMTADLALLPPE